MKTQNAGGSWFKRMTVSIAGLAVVAVTLVGAPSAASAAKPTKADTVLVVDQPSGGGTYTMRGGSWS